MATPASAPAVPRRRRPLVGFAALALIGFGVAAFWWAAQHPASPGIPVMLGVTVGAGGGLTALFAFLFNMDVGDVGKAGIELLACIIDAVVAVGAIFSIFG